MCLQLIYIYEREMALNNLKYLIYNKTQPIGVGHRPYFDIQHELLKVQNLKENSRYISHQSVHQKALKTD